MFLCDLHILSRGKMVASQIKFGNPSTWRTSGVRAQPCFLAVHWVTSTRLLATTAFTFGRLIQSGSRLVEGR